ncbi:cleft lip and palate transmembrane protein -like [Brachionus plicatilis]|uniref:Cleft lip and palate transmembrane protein-like n=1 Tax=Brachionus plicatilis TaxID=10195 RepID=A0A3M7SEA8_BRAPC|nr:cleft lip and palate transmembrane protein -like [Brachionus plicatilis]
MPDQDVAQGAANQENQGNQTWKLVQNVIKQMLIFYFISQVTSGFFKSKPQTQTSTGDSQSVVPSTNPGNIFPKGSIFDMHVYLSEHDYFDSFDDQKALYWLQPAIEYGNWNIGPEKDGILKLNGNFELTETMKNNGSIYLHVFFTENGRSPNPKDKETYSKRMTFSSFKRLNKYMKKTYKKTKNLLTGSTDKSEEYQQKAADNLVEIISHWHPNLTINLIDDQSLWIQNTVPPPMNEHVEFDKASGKYYPIIFLNDYWNLNSDYQPINDTLTHLNLSLTFTHLQLWKWQLYVSQSMKNQWSNYFSDDASEEDQDTLKKTLLDTNPYLLAVTIAVTIVHSVFEFLAFKNDIQFWKNRKDIEGLSVNSVLFGCFTQLIILLYVLDNETNTVVRISVGVGLLIDLWKIPKVLNVTYDYNNKYFGVIPRVHFAHKVSYVKSNTDDYDRLAFKYLSWVLFPLVVGYAVYSLIYHEHKGWYSWVLSMIYGFLLTFGFIMMTPQLFINYKLKSVAHLPWRMMTYKALNTFIDDLFAFVIEMPTMYRIGCFRDDIIFFIYLYQKWIYPVDKKRTNEFGSSGEDTVAVAEPQQQQQEINQQSTEHIKSE